MVVAIFSRALLYQLALMVTFVHGESYTVFPINATALPLTTATPAVTTCLLKGLENQSPVACFKDQECRTLPANADPLSVKAEQEEDGWQCFVEGNP